MRPDSLNEAVCTQSRLADPHAKARPPGEVHFRLRAVKRPPCRCASWGRRGDTCDHHSHPWAVARLSCRPHGGAGIVIPACRSSRIDKKRPFSPCSATPPRRSANDHRSRHAPRQDGCPAQLDRVDGEQANARAASGCPSAKEDALDIGGARRPGGIEVQTRQRLPSNACETTCDRRRARTICIPFGQVAVAPASAACRAGERPRGSRCGSTPAPAIPPRESAL